MRKINRKKAIKIGSIDCSNCKTNCCHYIPGLLIKEDLEKIAKFIGVTEQKLKQDYLDEVYMFHTKQYRPKRKNYDKPYGTCIFFKDRCSIHEVKPFQCRISTCKKEGEDVTEWFLKEFMVDKNDPISIKEYELRCKNV